MRAPPSSRSSHVDSVPQTVVATTTAATTAAAAPASTAAVSVMDSSSLAQSLASSAFASIGVSGTVHPPSRPADQWVVDWALSPESLGVLIYPTAAEATSRSNPTSPSCSNSALARHGFHPVVCARSGSTRRATWRTASLTSSVPRSAMTSHPANPSLMRSFRRHGKRTLQVATRRMGLERSSSAAPAG